ncbi:hypothetical protein BOTBODRAFT_37777 [Botryobasidium botryosum FD-172 SS1]|uniref:Uncharacterized protein n=1 Tax=Botryobasidium botryosum (strain FD-172 SS1) TaxID=930990 RepID=A0A067LYX5_BOTB1|nr:hypothetical protein BOTBODRAFT_37777 [Botryobasidium botryosum FD-172 SS1]
MTLTLASPLSLYSIPALWLVNFVPYSLKRSVVQQNKGGKYDNVQPRDNVAQLEKKGVPKEVIDKLIRLEGAHQNGLEVFPLWTAAVLISNFAGVSDTTLNTVSAAFLASRLLYTYLYANQSNEAVAGARSATWGVGIAMNMYLISAANKVYTERN